MQTSLRPAVGDGDRLRAVKRTGLLDSGPEESFDRLGQLARRLVGAPVALVSLVDAHRQYFACCLGLPDPYGTNRETPLSHSICQHALESDGPLVIGDVRADPRLVDNLAQPALGAEAYLGIPLVDRDNHVLGSFCVIDVEPREWTDAEIATMQDLAASVMAEIELREALHDRDRLAAIIDDTTDVVIVCSPDGSIVEANNAVRAALGFDPEDLIGRSIESLARDEDADALHRLVQRTSSDSAWRGEVVLRHVTGDPVPVSIVASSHERNGQASISWVARDISGERAAADRLADSEARLRDLLDGLVTFVALLTPQGTITELNAPAQQAAGMTAVEAKGKHLWDLGFAGWDQDVRDLVRDAVERARDGRSSRFDAHLRTPAGEIAVIDTQIVPLHDRTGAVSGIVASGLDVSERKQVEFDLARLAELEAAGRRRAEGLFQLAEALTGALTTDQVAGHVVRLGGEVVGASFSNLGVVDPSAGEVVLRHGETLDAAIGGRWPRVPYDDTTPIGRAIRRNKPVILSGADEIRTHYPSGADDAVAAGFEALAVFPALRRRAAVGFAWSEAPDFDEPLRNALATVAEIAGQALARSNLYERHRAVADRLQRAFLPADLPTVAGAQLAARYDAGGATEVGGDWYDVTRLGAGHVAVVGDVVGRGLEAAATMGQLRFACTALALDAAGVVDLVSRLDLFVDELDEGRYSTMVAVGLDPDGTAEIVSAGHLPPLVRRADGAVCFVTGGGPPLGFDPALERTSTTVQLEPGDSMLVYTDGLVERADESIDDSLDRLRRAAAHGSVNTPRQWCDDIHRELSDGQRDDIALLAIVRNAVA